MTVSIQSASVCCTQCSNGIAFHSLYDQVAVAGECREAGIYMFMTYSLDWPTKTLVH